MAFMAKAARSDEANAYADQAGAADEGSTASGSAAGVLAMAQKLHEQYVAEGQDTRERLITEGQSFHDQVIGEAAARKEELLSTGQAKYDEFLSVGEAKHDEFVSVGEAKHDVLIAEADALVAEATAEHARLLTEARERSTGMVVEAKKVRAEVLEGLGRDRSVLQQEIEDLRVFGRDHRAPLKSYIEDRLIELEHTAIDETATKQT